MEKYKDLFATLKARFEKNMQRHAGIEWAKVQAKLETYLAAGGVKAEKIRSLYEMEASGGEPDIIAYENANDEYVFYDCCAESPKERRSLCYDEAALNSRKEHKPKNSAIKMAEEMGIEILSEDEYRELQKLGDFDLKTSS